MNTDHQAPPASHRTWGPIGEPVYCEACRAGTPHRWADFDAEHIECQLCRGVRPIEHVEGDPAL